GLAREGRDATVCIPDAGAAQLMAVIRSAIEDEERSDKVDELPRPRDVDREGETPTAYTSTAECLNDQLRLLDLALLAEIDALESTIWDESVTRLQGRAISRGEVRALLEQPAPGVAPRHGAELRRKRQRLTASVAARVAASLPDPAAAPLIRVGE